MAHLLPIYYKYTYCHKFWYSLFIKNHIKKNFRICFTKLIGWIEFDKTINFQIGRHFWICYGKVQRLQKINFHFYERNATICMHRSKYEIFVYCWMNFQVSTQFTTSSEIGNARPLHLGYFSSFEYSVQVSSSSL